MRHAATATVLLLGALTLAGCAGPDPVPSAPASPAGEPCPAGLAEAVADREGLGEVDVDAFVSTTGLPDRYPPSCAFEDGSRALAFFPLEGGALIDALEGELGADDVEIVVPAPDLVARLADGRLATFVEAGVGDAGRTCDEVFDGIDYVVVEVAPSSP